jgi:hypothetical protein
MTQHRDLKRLVRERQARTGESYVTALRHVRGERASAIPVVELVDLSELAQTLGLTCDVLILPEVFHRIDPSAVLLQLRTVLRATAADPAFAVMREVVLEGRTRPRLPRAPDDTVQFAARLRGGIGGVSNNGRSLAFAVTGRQVAELLVFSLWMVPAPYDLRPPRLIITTPESQSIHVRFGLEGAR